MRPLCVLTLLAVLAGCASAPARRPGESAQGSEQWYDWTDDGVRLFVYELGRAAGPGDTVVVLHGGWGAEHSYLLDAVAPQSGRYRFVLYDQRGSLRSPAPDSSLTLRRMVADLEDLRQALGLERMTLLAHSMGNTLAYAYLAAHPERVRGLVLLGAVLPAPSGAPELRFVRGVWPEVDSAALAGTQARFYQGVWARAAAIQKREGLVPDSLAQVAPERLDLWSVLQDRARTRAWRISFAAVNTCTGEPWRSMQGGQAFYNAAVGRALGRDTTGAAESRRFWPALSAFPGPVRVLMGTCDYVDVGPTIWPHPVTRLRDGRLRVVEGGHSSWLEHPAEFRRLLAESLAEATR